MFNTALQQVVPATHVAYFAPEDLAELVVLQRCCWVQEAIANNTLEIPALHETEQEVLDWATSWTTLTVRLRGRLIAAVRGRSNAVDWEVGRLMVAPDFAGRGLGSALLEVIESLAPRSAKQFSLFTGTHSERNIRTYERARYQLTAPPHPDTPGHITGVVYMSKPVAR